MIKKRAPFAPSELQPQHALLGFTSNLVCLGRSRVSVRSMSGYDSRTDFCIYFMMENNSPKCPSFYAKLVQGEKRQIFFTKLLQRPVFESRAQLSRTYWVPSCCAIVLRHRCDFIPGLDLVNDLSTVEQFGHRHN